MEQTLRGWVEGHIAQLEGEGPLEGPRLTRHQAFTDVKTWLDENRVDVTPGFAERYEKQMARAGGIYADVVHALKTEVSPNADITQTGGMCLAITWPGPREGTYFLLTDKDDVLSWDRKPEDGWCLGLYADEDNGETLMPVVFSDLKHPATAVLLAQAAHAQWVARHEGTADLVRAVLDIGATE